MMHPFILISLLLILILTIPTSQNKVYSLYPLDHLNGILITNSILEFLSRNKTIPLHEIPSFKESLSAKTSKNCLICHKEFSNSSYLSIHYGIKHLDQLYEVYDESDTISFQIMIGSETIPIEERKVYCMEWLSNLKAKIEKKKINVEEKKFKHFAYLFEKGADGTQFCHIMGEKLFQTKTNINNLFQIVGITLIIFSLIFYALYQVEAEKKEKMLKKGNKRF